MDETPVKILHIEDDAFQATLVRRLLAKINTFRFDLTLEDRLSTGLQRLRSTDFDVILLDLILPDSSGLETFTRVYRYAPDIPIVVLSGNDDETTALKAVQQGAQDYLVKSQLKKGVLARALSYAIGRHRLLAELARQKRKLEQSEARFRTSEERLRSVINYAPVVLWAMDPDGTITFFEGRGLDVLGLQPGQVVGTSIFELYADYPEIIAAARRALAGEAITHVAEIDALFFENRYSPIHNEDGEVLGVIGVAVDITEQRRTEKTLQLHSIMLEHMVESVSLSSEDGIILYINPAGDTMFGYETGELIGEHVTILNAYEPEENARIVGEIIEQLQETGLWTGQFKNRKKDGTPFITSAHISALEIGGKKRWACVQQDITERLEAETKLLHAYDDLEQRVQDRTAELLHAKEAAEAASNAKSTFVANMSHELRTPLNGILGLSDLFNQTPLNEKQAHYIDMIRSSGKTLLRLINDVLDHAKLETGKLKLDPRSFDLASVLDGISAIYAVLAEEKGVRYTCDQATDALPTLVGDADRLQQVLLNLIGNALKFTDAGEVAVAVRTVSHQESTVILEFSVRDTGIGIPPEKQHTIFESFVQGDGALNRKYGGTGLGLAISKKIVELMDGRIWVESRIGEGSTFFFRVRLEEHASPAEAVLEPLLSKATAATAQIVRFTQPYRILLADDNFINREVAQEALRERGALVTSVEDGHAALEAMTQAAFDVVLMDVQMPIMDGLEATREFRATEAPPSHLPIIALTAHAMQEDRQKCLEAGMDAYVSKPVDFNELLRVIESLVSPVADLTVLLRNMNGKIERVERIVKTFLTQYKGEFQALRKAEENRDHDDLRRRAHGLKSGLGYLGAMQAHAHALALEQLNDNASPDEVRHAIDLLEADLERVDAYLAGGDWKKHLNCAPQPESRPPSPRNPRSALPDPRRRMMK